MNNQSTTFLESSQSPVEDTRRHQLVEVTIDSLAELGYVGTTLAQIATRAGVSPGLVAHYFGDKDGLLDAAFRSLARRVGNHVRARLRQVSTPRGRIQAVIDANLAPEEFEQRTGTAWLAFWGQVLHVPSLKRVQSVYQRRTLSNLRSSLKNLVPPDEARRLAAMIAAMIDGVWLRAALSEPVRLESMTFDLQASVGIAIYPDDATGFEQLMQRADVAMYLAKERRSGIERYAAAADRNSADRLALVGDLRRALHRGEIELHFQPKVLLAGEQVIGMEALARWRHPQRGLLTAAEFVGLAEQSYLMSELTDQVIDKALAQAAQWWADGLCVEVSVNVPARDLLSARLADLVSRDLQRHGLPPAALRLDINEQVVAGKSEQTASTVKALTDLGVGVSLDDFGTGYSSLALLTRLGVSEVKLDPTLVGGVCDSPDKIMTIKSLVNLASTLGIRSIGEGVENEATATALRVIGCDGAQGWFIGRPMNALLATTWLTEHRALSPAELTSSGHRSLPDAAHGPELAASARVADPIAYQLSQTAAGC